MSFQSDASDDSETGVEEPDRVSVVESACRSLSRAPPASARLAAARTQGNLNYGPRMQLICRTGFSLGIFDDTKVRGCQDYLHPNSLLEVHPSEHIGEVQIRGLQTNFYLAMNSKGRLYAEANASAPSTVFVEYMFGPYNVYLSKHWAHVGWYVGIKKSGKAKPGRQTRWGQKAIQFLPKRLNS